MRRRDVFPSVVRLLVVAVVAGGAAGCSHSDSPRDAGPPFRAHSFLPSDAGAPPLPIDWGAAQNQAYPPPPISGGTLLVTRDGTTAVAADPDRDAVHIVDLAANRARARIALAREDEPGRLAEDAARRVHVVLRRGGAVVTIDLGTHAVTARRVVCPAPRGIAYDPGTDALHVACAGGELVTLPAGGGGATRVLHLERDLRDVFVVGDEVRVTTFRAPSLIVLGPDGSRLYRATPHGDERAEPPCWAPSRSTGRATCATSPSSRTRSSAGA